ncbi:unnamed protein product [Strongylus vulgaris]|uniref:Laminin EGF-like domain-containing protein n=1 Tax=Strongylus vulgaris TaxID=40348 RepID=A0A3P7L674_STRVU|nr:unnamed protein product [Strongylus vulgaris]
MSSSGSSRLWVGPLLLILVIALIYIFSLMPNTPPPRELTPLIDDAHHVRTFRLGDHEITESFDDLKVEVPRECQCSGRLFGKACDLVCVEGQVIDGRCRCREERTVPTLLLIIVLLFPSKQFLCMVEKFWYLGYMGMSCATCDPTSGRECYMGMSCATCDPTSGRECEIPAKRRGAVNSRLTLSGLSFCMITIGLLCVTARRRRAGPLPPSEDTWYRVFQPAQSRAARCRHDLMCGNSWIPRDRALLVAPGRAAVVHGSSRSSR